MTSFSSFMLRNYVEEDSYLGDLARDIRDDPKFPRRARNYATILKYLLNCHACPEAITAFDDAYSLFEKNQQKECQTEATE